MCPLPSFIRCSQTIDVVALKVFKDLGRADSCTLEKEFGLMRMLKDEPNIMAAYVCFRGNGRFTITGKAEADMLDGLRTSETANMMTMELCPHGDLITVIDKHAAIFDDDLLVRHLQL